MYWSKVIPTSPFDAMFGSGGLAVAFRGGSPPLYSSNTHPRCPRRHMAISMATTNEKSQEPAFLAKAVKKTKGNDKY